MPQFRRYHLPDHCYFVTTTTVDRRAYFADRRLAEILLDNLRFYRSRMRFRLHGYVIMPDHVHLLVTSGGSSISDIMRNIKSFTSKQIREILGVKGAVWQSRFHDRIVRDETEFRAVLEYIHLNPVKAGLVASPEGYKFSSYSAYAGLGTAPLEVDPLEEVAAGAATDE